MADKGIIFSAPMVRALLDGTKTQTRRLCKSANIYSSVQPLDDAPGWFGDDEGKTCFSTGYKPGQRLYVRETWAVTTIYDGMRAREINPDGRPNYCGIRYAATDARNGIRDRPSIHMPRWASRITLTVTDVRVERLQDIGEADAIAEGIEQVGRYGGEPLWKNYSDGPTAAFSCPIKSYRALWNSLHAEPSTRWEDNPWIVAVSFSVRHGNIDEGQG